MLFILSNGHFLLFNPPDLLQYIIIPLSSPLPPCSLLPILYTSAEAGGFAQIEAVGQGGKRGRKAVGGHRCQSIVRGILGPLLKPELPGPELRPCSFLALLMAAPQSGHVIIRPSWEQLGVCTFAVGDAAAAPVAKEQAAGCLNNNGRPVNIPTVDTDSSSGTASTYTSSPLPFSSQSLLFFDLSLATCSFTPSNPLQPPLPSIIPLLLSPSLHPLEVFSGLVLRLCGGEVILQEGLQVLKSVPLISLTPPALQHQFMERGGAARGTGHPVASLHLLQHLTLILTECFTCPQATSTRSKDSNDTTEDNAGQTVLPLSLWRASEVGGVTLTHPNVPKAALSQLPLHGQRFPGHLPGIPPKAHGERDGVETGLCQVCSCCHLPPLQHSPLIPTHPDFSKLAVAQFLNQLKGFTGNLPHILGLH
ncbi:hypothetical protein FQN60_007487 [Etheostoma spectabile]|uniref:Uncharacterized protein n=1 Tax=Etheostoma spectabile TaxID=54343 RepID=A0A5J5CTY8_9PERO|nr:hypothetical protein FQN60_007487 [Etheostoma spectabile]